MSTFVFYFTLSIIAVVLLIALVIIIVEILIPKGIIKLASIDTGWSIFHKLPPPGELYILVDGSPKGPFAMILSSIPGWNYDYSGKRMRPTKKVIEKSYLGRLGVAYTGFWRYLFYKEVRYDKWEKLPGKSETEWGLVSKEHGTSEKGASIFFIYNMAVLVKNEETSDNFPTDALIAFTLQLTDPVRALFLSGGFEVQTASAVSGDAREYIGTKNINDLREEKRDSAKDKVILGSLIQRIKSLNLFKLYGVKILDARFVYFDLATGDEEVLKATKAKAVATLKAEARKIDGQGERWEREEKALGIKAEVAAWGSNPVGGQVVIAEAIKIAKPNVLGGNFMVSVDSKKEKDIAMEG